MFWERMLSSVSSSVSITPGKTEFGSMPQLASKNWYALYTRSRHEKKVTLLLTRAGLDCYLPLRRVKKKWSDRMKMVEEPLFKGYLFVHIEYRRDRIEVLRQLGSVHIVTFEGQPAVVEPHIIATLHQLEERAISMEAVPALNFSPGDEVLIRQGPFKGIRAKVERLKNTTRLMIALPMLGQIVQAEVDPWDIEKV